MMEGSLVADTGQTDPLIVLSTSASPLSPSTNPRPFRPKPPPPPTPKPTSPSTHTPLLPPPLPPIVKTPCFNPPPNLPPPLSPTPASPASPVQQTDASASAQLSPESHGASSTFDPLASPELPALSLVDKLHHTASVWQTTGLSQEQVTDILKEEQPGVFLVHGADEGSVTLSVREPEPHVPPVHSLNVKQHGTCLRLDGSFLLFDDIFKLVSFYCVSRDVLPLSLRLPQAITTATERKELEVIAAAGKDFWTSEQHHQSKTNCCSRDQSGIYLHLNSVIVAENPIRTEKPEASTSEPEATASHNAASPLPNGETQEKVNVEVKVHSKPHNSEMKYKRPPPRPPSVSGGMGLLFSASPSTQSPTASDKKDETKVVEEKNDKKSASNAPSRPPMPQSRAGPPLPRAPLRSSSRKSNDGERERVEGMEREKGHNLTKQDEKEGAGGAEPGEESERIRPVQLEKESGCQQQREEVDAEKDATEDKQKSSGLSLLVKKPSRPVPPPRRKPQTPESPVCPNQGGAGGGGASRLPPPSPGRRPDVSLYSPQGGAVLGTDPDSASTSSTEEEAETQDQSRGTESRSPKPGVKRTPTTVILDRARHRLSTVLTGLISPDRRLTQKIVELARDPSSYFGNLVKEHRAFTLESMSRHASSTELLQEIRQMMTQLKSYLLQSTELHGMMEAQHPYAQDKLESITEAALCKSVLKPLRDPIYQCLDKLHSEHGTLEKLSQNQSVVLGSTSTALGVTTAVPEASAMEKISVKLSNLHLEYSPQKKIEMLLKACKIIYDSMAVSSPGRAHGADDFLPVMMYVLARCNLCHLRLDVEYMMELMDPALTLGEGSYYLTTTYGALEHIKTFDQQRSATRQLSREVQDSIHRWERRRTLNKESTGHTSVRDFLTVCCPNMGENPKTLGVLPTTTIEQLREQCASRYEQEISELGLCDPDSFILSVVINEEHRPLALSEVALSVKKSCQPGAYCFVFHHKDQPVASPAQSGPKDPPPVPPPLSPPSAPPPAPNPSMLSPNVPPPISTAAPGRPPNVPPPTPTTSSAPSPTSTQRSTPPPAPPPIRPSTMPPPTPSPSPIPPSIPPPISAPRSMPSPSRVSPPNVPPPTPRPSVVPPKTPPPSVKAISVATSTHPPAPPPPTRPPALPPPLQSTPPSVPPPVPSPAPAIVPPSETPPTAQYTASSDAVPPPVPPPTVSPPPECTSLDEAAETEADAEAAEEDSLISL